MPAARQGQPSGDGASPGRAAPVAPPTPPPRDGSPDTALLAGEEELLGIDAEVERCYRSLAPLDPYDVVRRGAAASRCKYPMILVVGNYSSGKSTFVNSLIGGDGALPDDARQEIGASPTDSGFTLLRKTGRSLHPDASATPSPESRGSARPATTQTLSGSAVLGDPDLGFAPLKRFGDVLESRIKLKTVSSASCRGPLPDNVVLVDTPGLTDFDACSQEIFAAETMHSVMLWFASHADLILYLFDPMKPAGAEQRQVLLSLLKEGHEGKVKFVFNKVDQLASTQDVILSFGTLCWTLSKYFPRKEPPLFYTVYTPGCASPAGEGMSHCLRECDDRRAELLKFVRQVPFDRANTLIKQVEGAVHRLHVACYAGDEAIRLARQRRGFCSVALSLFSATLACIYAHLYLSVEADDPLASVLFYALSLVLSVGLFAGLLCRAHLQSFYETLLRDRIDECFTAGHAKSGRALQSAARGSEGGGGGGGAPSDTAEETWGRVKRMWNMQVEGLSGRRVAGPRTAEALCGVARRIELLYDKAQRYRDALEGG